MNSCSLRRPKGAISIVFAALLIIALGFFGLAIDVGYAHVQKTRLQAIADAAALACVIDNDTCGAGGNNRFTCSKFGERGRSDHQSGRMSRCWYPI